MAARSKDARRAAYRKGRWAEILAALALRLNGYRIVATRVRSPAGEIDIVARRANHFAFVEVKARSDFDTASHAVSQRQRRRIWQAAQWWLARAASNKTLPADYSVSIDALLVVPWRWPQHIVQGFGHGQ